MGSVVITMTAMSAQADPLDKSSPKIAHGMYRDRGKSSPKIAEGMHQGHDNFDDEMRYLLEEFRFARGGR